MKIKVCGLKDPENIKALAALAPDLVGFICYERSLRFIDGLSPEAVTALPQPGLKTAVFVNESAEKINLLIDKFGFDAIQLHGSESPEFCGQFKGRVMVLKAFGLDDDFNFESLNAYQGIVDYFIFDTKTSAHGGSGKTFNWAVLERYELSTPFFLSGGLSLDNLAEVKQISHPAFYGVDLNSRFETAPGIKDIEKLKKAFELIRN
jgi:phosphoribosylanthranilate isomerase